LLCCEVSTLPLLLSCCSHRMLVIRGAHRTRLDWAQPRAINVQFAAYGTSLWDLHFVIALRHNAKIPFLLLSRAHSCRPILPHTVPVYHPSVWLPMADFLRNSTRSLQSVPESLCWFWAISTWTTPPLPASASAGSAMTGRA